MVVDDRPRFSLDPHGKILTWNRSMAELTGWPAAELVGRPWSTVGSRVELTRLRTPANRFRAGELVVRDRRGHKRTLTVIIGPADPSRTKAGTMCFVESPALAADFEISNDEPFGEITRVHDLSQHPLVGKRCYEHLAGRPVACDACPAVGLPAGARRTALVTGCRGRSVLVRAVAVEGRTTIIHEPIEPSALDILVRARLDEIAISARLSAREREVLHGLFESSAIDAIARALHITPRTVKFHAGNALAKLGLSSRLELPLLLRTQGAAAHPPVAAGRTTSAGKRRPPPRRRSS